MKIVKELPKEYRAIQFDLPFVKKYGLIKYPMVQRGTKDVSDGYDYKNVMRTDIFGKLFHLYETERRRKYKEIQAYYLINKGPSYVEWWPLESKHEVKDGDWIVTDKKGKSKVYSPEEFKENFERKDN